MAFSLSSYDFNLPKELIAQKPKIPRDRSRLMLIDRASETISEMVFSDLVQFLSCGDSLIFNDTRVIPARLYGKKSTGGIIEILLVKPKDSSSTIWEVLAKPGKKLKDGEKISFGKDFSAEVLQTLSDGSKLMHFLCEGKKMEHFLELHGQVPLPHYISQKDTEEVKRKCYQTIYASKAGAVAAPTAGLHFSPKMFQEFSRRNIERHTLTLHVGPGTFRPVKEKDIRKHKMHAERYNLSEEVVFKLNASFKDKSLRRVCVGTTCCRVLESLASDEGILSPSTGETDIFIYPGYRFKFVDALLTNFHLPGSSLLMLVSAFAGKELIFEAYERAIKERFRFYSYGDAMLII